ncbi:Inverted formin-2 [Chionoecetes opilio]|uniref:Inverted formin-2 n=1 Tax=Chionoecetes opilio TaxID=41210 RepID=A0A8J4XL72_CHIOP|nr:Inverted formin-2 [Chionoecetes opilio]
MRRFFCLNLNQPHQPCNHPRFHPRYSPQLLLLHRSHPPYYRSEVLLLHHLHHCRLEGRHHHHHLPLHHHLEFLPIHLYLETSSLSPNPSFSAWGSSPSTSPSTSSSSFTGGPPPPPPPPIPGGPPPPPPPPIPGGPPPPPPPPILEVLPSTSTSNPWRSSPPPPPPIPGGPPPPPPPPIPGGPVPLTMSTVATLNQRLPRPSIKMKHINWSKQFKASHAEVCGTHQAVSQCRDRRRATERLLRIFPEDSEAGMIKEYQGDPAKLGNAEKFYVELLRVEGYQVRLEGMMQMEELHPAADRLRPQIASLVTTADKILASESLKEFFAYILTLGNFINMECLISGIPFALHIKNMRIFTIVPTATSAHYGTLHLCLVTTT